MWITNVLPHVCQFEILMKSAKDCNNKIDSLQHDFGALSMWYSPSIYHPVCDVSQQLRSVLVCTPFLCY